MILFRRVGLCFTLPLLHITPLAALIEERDEFLLADWGA
jgi:hypothetical protein